jgi:hypothetical protein
MALIATGITTTAVSSGTPNGTTIYTSSGNNAITTMMACNNSGSAINLTLYAVPSGKSAYVNPECTIVSQLSIPAGDTVSFDQEKMVLGNNDIICGIASVAYTGTGISVVISTLPV